jgi:DNA-binding transcriptional LysR family regulator
VAARGRSPAANEFGEERKTGLRMNQITAMRVFCRVVDLGSFTLAATQLGMSPAAVTRHVSVLEAHVNVKLINRSTRRLRLTEAGCEYREACRTILENLDAVESSLARSTRKAHGMLRIGSANAFASLYLCELLAAYRRTQNAVEFDIRTFDVSFDLVEEGFDVCFDHHPQVRSTLICRPLISSEEVLVASPAYVRERGAPDSPASLRDHDLLSLTDGVSKTRGGSGGAVSSHAECGRTVLSTSSPAVVRVAALNGMGIAQLPTALIREDIEQGTLVRLLEAFPTGDTDRFHSLIYQGRSHLTAKVRTFVDFTVTFFRIEGRAPSFRVAA